MFKVGDRIRTILHSGYSFDVPNMTGTVIKVYSDNTYVDVTFDIKEGDWIMFNEEIEKIGATKPVLKFRAGDRVKTTAVTPYTFDKVGMMGVILHMYDTCGTLALVQLDDHDGEWNILTEMLELVPTCKSVKKEEIKVERTFKVGDLVKGTERGIGEYTLTADKMTKGKVTQVNGDGTMMLTILEHERDSVIGQSYEVEPQYFDLLEVKKEVAKTGFKVGDIVRGKVVLHPIYGVTNEKMTRGEVLKVYTSCGREYMEVKVLERTDGSYIGNDFPVECEYFELAPSVKTAGKVEVIRLENGVKVVYNEPYTIVTKKVNGLTFEGKARCGHGDQFDKATGLEIALDRLLDVIVEELNY